jgi:hypothetical protein
MKESEVQKEIIDYLKVRDWLVKSTHGNMYQWGFPDLYCAHRKYGTRWVEVKLPTGRFTPAQLEWFPKFQSVGVGVWVMLGTYDYEKLFSPPNWFSFLMK